MLASGNYSIIKTGWYDTHDGIPDMAWTLPANVKTSSRSILQYKTDVWFDSGWAAFHIRINGITVGKPKFTDDYYGTWYTIVKRNVLQPGRNVVTWDVIFGPDFEGPSAQAVGDVILIWQDKIEA